MAIFRRTPDAGTNPDAPMSSKSGTPAPPGQVNIIGQGTVIEGGLKAKSDVRISGKVVGNVNVEGKTVVTPEGAVEGEVRSSQADIAGKIDGEVFVSERLVLKTSAVVEGNIHTAKLVIEDGATFTGTCTMGGTLPKPGSRPALPAKASSDDRNEPKRGDRPTDRPASPANP